MKKIIELEPSYYRLNLQTGNIIYLSHVKDVKDSEYVDLSIKDILAKIDELVEAYNALSPTVHATFDSLPPLEKKVGTLASSVLELQQKIQSLQIETQPTTK